MNKPDNRRWLDFLELAPRSTKPRKQGLTMVGDEGQPITWMREMLDSWGEYVDYMKFVPALLMLPWRVVEERVKLYRDHQINVVLDDPIFAIAYYLGKADELLHAAREMGFTHCQIDTQVVRVEDENQSKKADEDNLRYEELAKTLGYKLLGEVGQKHPEGDPARAEGGLLNVPVIIAKMKQLLASGCEHVFLECHVMREAIGSYGEKEAGAAQLLEIVEAVGQDKIMIEISNQIPAEARACHRLWSVRHFGPDVNFGGGASLSEVRHIEAIRRGVTYVPGPSKSTSRLWVKNMARHKGKAEKEWWKEEYPIDPDAVAKLR